MANRIQLRRDTAAAWQAANPLLTPGEVGVDLTNKKIKIGDGVTLWNSLEYFDDQVTRWADITGKPTALSQFTNDQGFLNTSAANLLYQPLDPGLTSIATLNGVNGLLRKTGTNVFAIDTNSYITRVPAEGQTYYVSKNGDDDNSGDSIDKPFASLNRALLAAIAGDTIKISSGEFTETFPMFVPAGVSVIGSGLRATTIKPTSGTISNDGFLLNGESTLSDFTVLGQRWNAGAGTGYAFKIATGAVFTKSSPYIERVSIISSGSVTSNNDPYGFDSGDAGRGVFVDGSVLNPASIESALLFNEVTMIVPNSVGFYLTNGARIETLNCFVYFADTAVLAESGDDGRYGQGTTKLRVAGHSGSPIEIGQTFEYYELGSLVASAEIIGYNSVSGLITLEGKVLGLEESIISAPAQDIKFTDGGLNVGTAEHITLLDYKEFGAEHRSISCAFVYGNQGVNADGLGVELNLMAHNFSYIGSGKDLTNDPNLAVTNNEVISVNGAKVYYNSIDHLGEIKISSAGNLLSFNKLGRLTLPNGTSFSTDAPTTSKGQPGDIQGLVVFDNNYIYTCVSNYTNGVADIWKRMAWPSGTW